MASSNAIYRRVWDFAWPAIISNISVPLLGLVDSAVLGHLPSSEYLGGVAIGATIFSFLFWAFGFLRMGTTGLVAQACGRRDSEAIRRWLLQSMALAGMIGLLIMAFSPLIIRYALPFFDASPAVSAQARIYFETRIFSAPAVLCNYALVGWLLGMQKPRGPLMMLVIANATNIVLDLLFVLGLGWATEGAAMATVIADYLSLALGLIWVRRVLGTGKNTFDWWVLLNFSAFKQLIMLNRHLFVRTLCLLFTQAFFTSRGAQIGDEVLAANALLLNLLMLISNGLDGFAHAAEALAGEALGQRQLDRFKGVVRVTGYCSLVCGLMFMLAFALGGDLLLNVLTDIPEVASVASEYMPWLVMMPLVAVWCYWLDGVFIGAVKTDMMQHTTLLATVGAFLPCWYITQSMGNHGLWLAYTTFMLVRSLGLAVAYRRISINNGWLIRGI
ncbi:MATE family efflux transporter [Endozoicomonas sp. Mp262]|uniref:MATE family efflux transporter n=1 Tax=Endozoicomonas sp. Mp262 TaxID=2919499 RepID=UPI0021D89BC2